MSALLNYLHEHNTAPTEPDENFPLSVVKASDKGVYPLKRLFKTVFQRSQLANQLNDTWRQIILN